MTEKEKIIQEVQDMPESMVREVGKFIRYLKQKRSSQDPPDGTSEVKDTFESWSDFALAHGSFDFWNDPEEVEYTPDDITKK